MPMAAVLGGYPAGDVGEAKTRLGTLCKCVSRRCTGTGAPTHDGWEAMLTRSSSPQTL